MVVDADAWDPPALAAALQALALDEQTPPVLLIGERLPTILVRNLLRLERSDVLEAPFTAEQFVGCGRSPAGQRPRRRCAQRACRRRRDAGR